MKNIKKEYDKKWTSILKQIHEIKSNDFISLHKKINIAGILSKKNKFLNNKWFIYDNQIKNISPEKVYLYKHIFLTNKLLEKLTSFDEIIELGSGWGSRILYINEILNKKCFSGEINENGIIDEEPKAKRTKTET